MPPTRSIFKMLMSNSGRESETGSLTVSDVDHTARVLFCEDGWAVLQKLGFSKAEYKVGSSPSLQERSASVLYALQ